MMVLALIMAVAAEGPSGADSQPLPNESRSSVDWPQFRGDLSLDGVSTSPVPDNPQLLWTFDTGEMVDSSAAIANGVVYVGTYAGDLIALNLSDGSLRWRYHASEWGIGESSPAVANGTVYIGDLSGVLHAVDINTGKARWTFETEAEIKSSPVLVNGIVLIGSYDSHLYGLSADSGNQIWKVETSSYVHATPAVVNGIAYFGGCDEEFRGVRVSDGEEIFAVSSGAYTAASPTIIGTTAFYGTFANEVLALDLDQGVIRWRYEHPTRHFPFYSSPAFHNGLVVLGGRDRMVHALNAETGKSQWVFTTRGRIDSSPAIAGDRVYVGSNDGLSLIHI